jgi:hypothetical protein
MSSRSGALKGSQEPRFALSPAASWSEADDAAFLAASYGLTPDPWQHLVLESWLGRNGSSKWAASRCGLAVPRQNGKNGVAEIRELYGMVALGEKFLHTAHEVKTARKAFLRLKFFFGEKANDPAARFPELNALVESVRSANGQEAIFLRNGASAEFVARTQGSGRGFTVDVLVLDEAQELTEEQLEALQSTISSAPLGNPQTIMVGTPPRSLARGDAFLRMRSLGVEGKNRRLSWHEWSVKGNVDHSDRKCWAEANPSLGGRLHLSVVLDEFDGLSRDGFMRERLGVWPDPDDLASVFPAGAWLKRLDAGAERPDRVAIAVDTAPDGSATGIGYCGRSAGLFAVDVDYTRDHQRVVARVVERYAALHGVGPVVLCGRGAVAYRDDLEAAGLTTLTMSLTDNIAACAQFYASVVGGEESAPDLVHRGSGPLDAAVAGAVQKETPDGWHWNRRGPVDISPLVAVTGARWALARSTVDLSDEELLMSFW